MQMNEGQLYGPWGNKSFATIIEYKLKIQIQI